MVKLYPLLLLFLPVAGAAQRDFSVEDLLEISSISPKQADNYISKRGFIQAGEKRSDGRMPAVYLEKLKRKKQDTVSESRSIEIFSEENDYCIRFRTCSKDEYEAGLNTLKKSSFAWDSTKALDAPGQTFRRRNLIVEAGQGNAEGENFYTFVVKRREFPHPSEVRYAEDLLNFDSHEFLVAYFGEANVSRDVFYFSEKELRKCTVLFGNTSRQAVFIWENERTLSGISFILISGLLPTLSAVEYSGNISQNTWELKSGIRTGMRVIDLLQLNGEDFNFFGNKSEFSLMVEPVNTGNLNFSKTGVMLSCFDNSAPLLASELVSAKQTVEKGLPLYVAYVMVSK